MVLIGAGIGLMLLPLAASATAGIEPRYAGLTSGLFNMARETSPKTTPATNITQPAGAAADRR